jgi:hypothetical protein
MKQLVAVLQNAVILTVRIANRLHDQIQEPFEKPLFLTSPTQPRLQEGILRMVFQRFLQIISG